MDFSLLGAGMLGLLRNRSACGLLICIGLSRAGTAGNQQNGQQQANCGKQGGAMDGQGGPPATAWKSVSSSRLEVQ
jgi:hypothetical protein